MPPFTIRVTIVKNSKSMILPRGMFSKPIWLKRKHITFDMQPNKFNYPDLGSSGLYKYGMGLSNIYIICTYKNTHNSSKIKCLKFVCVKLYTFKKNVFLGIFFYESSLPCRVRGEIFSLLTIFTQSSYILFMWRCVIFVICCKTYICMVGWLS